MNALSMPLRQLVDRKLWPLAILLIAALVAVPMLLAKEDVAPPAPPVPVVGGTATADASAGATQPIVSLGDASQRESARKVLGARKNPFQPAVRAKKAKAATATSTSPVGTTKVGGAAEKKSEGGSSAPSTQTPFTGAAPLAPVAKKKTYELFSLKIRFGTTDSRDLANRSIKRLAALPRMDDPVLIYLGLKKDLRTAVFLVDANTMVVGDGKCVPHPTNCQNLELKKGQTAFIDVLGEDGASTAQYELDFVKVLKKTTTNAKAARASRLAVAKGGRKALRAKVSRVNGWNYDPDTGVLIPPGD